MIFQPGATMKSFKHITLATALFAALAGSAIAAPVTYGVDGSHTFPRFSYSHFGYSTQLSSFKNTSGKVVFDAEAKTGSVDITIDMKSVNTGFDDFNGHLQGEDFLDTAKFPTATFKSTKVVFEGDKPKSIEGNLTIKGVTKPVTLTVTSFQSMPHPMMKKPALGANAFTVIKRSEFNAGKYAPYVGDEVRIDVAIEAVAQ
jgi:polyisoprenoid-binding protein YceI